MAMRKTVRIGVIGCGGFARGMHIRNMLQNPKFEIVAACDLDLARAEAVQDEIGAHYSTTDPEELFADSDVDAVLITTRHDSHAALRAYRPQRQGSISCAKNQWG